MNKKTLSIINAVTFVLMIAVNVISTFGLLGVTPVKDISDRYTNLLVPMGYTFSVIWTVIYAGLLYYTIKELVGKEDKYNINALLIVSNILNILWLVTFTYNMFLLSCIVIISLLIVLYTINDRIYKNDLIKNIFATYTSWVLVASIINTTTFLISLDTTRYNSTAIKVISLVLLVASAIVIQFYANNASSKITYVFAISGIVANHVIKFNYLYLDLMVTAIIIVFITLFSIMLDINYNNKSLYKNETV